MKLHDEQSAKRAFFRRTESRRERLQGLVDMWRSHEISVGRFRHLTQLCKSEQLADQRETGFKISDAQFK